MILSGKTIKKLLEDKVIQITPTPQIKEASVKIHLSNQFSPVDQEFATHETYTLKPKEFIIGKSKETIIIPETIAGLYDGYTKLARKGIMTHMGSMFIDPGTSGQITFEIYNASEQEIILEVGMRVGHIVFLQVK
jgi:deoxycytidine triphosphate deaminase